MHDVERARETATKETQESATLAFIQVIRLFYALKQLDDVKEYLTLPLFNSLKVLEKFRSRLFEVAQAAELSDGDDCTYSRKELYSMVRKLSEKSTDNVAEASDITCKPSSLKTDIKNYLSHSLIYKHTLTFQLDLFSFYDSTLLVDKHVYGELDHLTYPSADLKLRDTPLVSDGRQVDEPSSTVKAHTRTGKEDDVDGTSARSLMSEPTLAAAQKSCATVENWFSKISPSNPPSSESPPKTTLGPESKAVARDVDAKQAEPIPIVPVRLNREIASRTDQGESSEPSSLPAAAVPMPPRVVPLAPVHPMPGCK